MKNLTIGIELEFGIIDSTGTPRVSGRILDADKHRPLDIGGTLFHKDASMLEIAFPPCSSQAELDTVVQAGIDTARGMLPDGWSLTTCASLEYSDEELAFDPYASEMGCSPSLNLYGLDAMPDEYPDNVRYCGMHVNVGHAGAHDPAFVFALDRRLAIPHVTHLVATGDDAELAALRVRRKFYGRAGEFRQRPFGVEYRTLPVGAWPVLGPRLFDIVADALRADPAEADGIVDITRNTIQHAGA